MGNEHNISEDNELFSGSIDKSFTDDDSYDGFISTNALKDIQDGI